MPRDSKPSDTSADTPAPGTTGATEPAPEGWYVLNDGTTLPPIGFGTASLRGAKGHDAVLTAIAAGYRLIDSAERYENEGLVGAAVRDSGVPRSELRITSKVRGDHHSARAARETVEESLYRTGLDYLDLMLVHWPLPRLDSYSEVFGACCRPGRMAWSDRSG